MLSNIYVEEVKYDRSMGLRKEIKEKGLKKSPGCSSIEVNGSVHGFLVEENSHPCYNEINSTLEKIENLMNYKAYTLLYSIQCKFMFDNKK